MAELGKQLAERTGFGLLSFCLTFALISLIGVAAVTAAPETARVFNIREPGLTAFRSDSELRAFLRQLRQERRRRMNFDAAIPMASVAAPEMVQEESGSDLVVTGSRAAAPGITNNQVAGVDEGGIVKVHGNHLVILRRGRLFTVTLADGGMRPVDSINAFPPGVKASGDWYDEMLVSGDKVIVVGYSYERGGTEINRFRIDRQGRLLFEDAYHLRSNDYYSSRNYASRLIGDKLIYYTPLYLSHHDDPLDALPAVRRWRDDSDGAFKRIIGARQVFVPPLLRNGRDAQLDTLHSVITCNLGAPELDCSATAVLGPESRTFYVSGEAVYLWISDAWNESAERPRSSSFIYRLPLGSQRPSAIAVRGAPVDQFSFREDADDGVLNVLVRGEGGGDAMWRPEVSEGAVALLRVPISAFGDGSREVPLSRYRPLPSPRGESWNFRNRFVGNHVLYGGGAFDEAPSEGSAMVVAAPVRGGDAVELQVPHSVDRIEALGRDALVVGGGGEGDLYFSAVELAGRSARLGSRYTHPASSEGETRSHAFFFNPDPHTPRGESGLLGLPVARRVEPAFQRFFGRSAAMLFLHRDQRRFAPAGELAAKMEGIADDGCQASCVDWYGNARPIFLGNRIFALLGYELVEGRLSGRSIREIDRVNFAPRMERAERR